MSDIKITIYGAQSVITGAYPKPEFMECTSYEVEGAKFSPAYRKKSWDGRKNLAKARTGSFPTGLVPTVRTMLEQAELDYVIDDRRQHPGRMDLFGKPSYELSGGYTLRPYQLRAAQAAVENEGGILKMATGAGKSITLAGVITALNVPTLVIVPSRELLYQLRATFLAAIPNATEASIGIVGDSEWQPGTFVTVATMSTLYARLDTEECAELLRGADLLCVDECFPAGTLIDGKPIETLKVGDTVRTVDHTTGLLRNRKIVRTFKKLYEDDLITLQLPSTVIKCTKNHPIFVKRKGYICAEKVVQGDMLCVRRNIRESVSSDSSLGVGRRMGTACIHTNETEARIGISDLLQSGYSESWIDDCYRGGWSESLRQESFDRPEEGSTLEWVGVESTSREKQESVEGTFVYNIEVEGSHTYFANDTLVHNCHGAGSDTWYDVTQACNAYYRVACSGTPYDRSDGGTLRLIASFGEKVADIGYKELVESGVLPRAKIIFDKITGPVLPKKPKLTYAQAYLQGVTHNEVVTQRVVEWTRICVEQGLSVLILVDQIEHGKIIDEALWNTEGTLISHTFIHGSSSNRDEALGEFARREIPVLIGSSILDTGISIDSVDVLICAGSRKSKIKVLQRLGRALRGKKAIVIEFFSFVHKFLLDHSQSRFKDYKDQDCFILKQSKPDADLIKRLWEMP